MIETTINKIKQIYTKKSSYLIIGSIITGVLFIIDIIADVTLGSGKNWANYIRCVLALLTAVPLFSTGYMIALKQHDGQVEKAIDTGTEYVEWRLRFSYRKRLQHSIIVGACLALLGIITSYTRVYTISAAVILAGGFALIVYCRLTNDERTLKNYGVPDPRDVLDDSEEAEAQLADEAKQELKDEIKRKKKGQDTEEDNDDQSSDDSDDTTKHNVWKL
jgi:hypothetical protein